MIVILLNKNFKRCIFTSLILLLFGSISFSQETKQIIENIIEGSNNTLSIYIKEERNVLIKNEINSVGNKINVHYGVPQNYVDNLLAQVQDLAKSNSSLVSDKNKIQEYLDKKIVQYENLKSKLNSLRNQLPELQFAKINNLIKDGKIDEAEKELNNFETETTQYLVEIYDLKIGVLEIQNKIEHINEVYEKLIHISPDYSHKIEYGDFLKYRGDILKAISVYKSIPENKIKKSTLGYLKFVLAESYYLILEDCKEVKNNNPDFYPMWQVNSLKTLLPCEDLPIEKWQLVSLPKITIKEDYNNLNGDILSKTNFQSSILEAIEINRNLQQISLLYKSYRLAGLFELIVNCKFLEAKIYFNNLNALVLGSEIEDKVSSDLKLLNCLWTRSWWNIDKHNITNSLSNKDSITIFKNRLQLAVNHRIELEKINEKENSTATLMKYILTIMTSKLDFDLRHLDDFHNFYLISEKMNNINDQKYISTKYEYFNDLFHHFDNISIDTLSPYGFTGHLTKFKLIDSLLSESSSNEEKIKISKIADSDLKKLLDHNESFRKDLETTKQINRKRSHYLGNLSWYQILEGEFLSAEKNSNQALELDPKQTWIVSNQALSKLLLNKIDEAKKIYLDFKNVEYPFQNNITFRDIFIEDLKAIKEIHGTSQNINRIELLLKE